MRHDMGRCLEVMQFARKDLETVTDNLEMLEGTVYYWQLSSVWGMMLVIHLIEILTNAGVQINVLSV